MSELRDEDSGVQLAKTTVPESPTRAAKPVMAGSAKPAAPVAKSALSGDKPLVRPDGLSRD